MIKLLWLLLLAIPQQSGKVVLNTHVPDAEFYLDGNFVAETDAKGTLTMENFPAGSFNYSVEKKGYQPCKGSFSIGEGETQLLTPTLARVIEQEEPREEAGKPVGTSSSAAGPPKIAGKASAPAEQAPPRNIEDSYARVPVALPSPGRTLPEKSQAVSLPIIGAILLAMALIVLSISIRKRNRPELPFSPATFALDTAPVQPQPDGAARPAPEFIDDLKRREELIKAGFIASKPQVVDPASMKQKEVVIVLPKEAFRFEDDK